MIDRSDRLTQKIIEVLRDTDSYPDEMRSFIPKTLENNVLLKLVSYQLPDVDKRHDFGASGEPAFQNSWVAYGGAVEVPGFYKDPLGRVFLYGTAKNGTSGTTIATLPGGYRPRARELFSVITNTGVGEVDIDGSGNIIHVSGGTGFVQLSGISFRNF